ncbi:MAG: SIMPL domain-containing protein [Bacteroidetes bacterium]|nr:SIMPL domain-containing protein [Bacteroidota bacterium]
MKKLILIFAAAFCFAAQAQDIQKPYIEVTGTSETEVTPDEITITITLQESKERANINKQEERMKKAFTELGINLTNLTLNSADADFQRVKAFNKKETLISKTYLLKLSNAEILSKVYQKLSELDAQDAYISKVNYSKIEEVKKENSLKALKVAKEKAENLLSAIGHQTGMPLQIYEQQNGIVNPVSNYRMATKSVARLFDAEDSSSEPDISFRKIKIVNTFYVKYEIK